MFVNIYFQNKPQSLFFAELIKGTSDHFIFQFLLLFSQLLKILHIEIPSMYLHIHQSNPAEMSFIH